jgi:hypothetical protein
MELEEKIKTANRVIDAVLLNFRQPAVMWSGGKDSMVLLFLLRARQVNVPVIFWRQPFFAEKHEFQERIAREWDLRLYDWPPAMVKLTEGNGHLSVLNYYQVGPLPGGTCAVPVDVYEPAKWDGKWICGLRDLLHRPAGGFAFPWDCCFHGHKSSDTDPLLGSVPLEQEIAFPASGPALAFPLRDWTDADIWEYTRRYDVPQQWDRYAPGTGEENPDRTANADYYAGCVRCMERQDEKTVWCPKLKARISNISAQLPFVKMPRPDYIAKEAAA